ncbi:MULTISPECIES: helix-turn-helix transcriptional regulator [Methylomonas]|uniref:helix-turn-helix transcriptional regulator n=1 Tax=Methylomonas TaxID=416 RepID=UPI00345B77C8
MRQTATVTGAKIKQARLRLGLTQTDLAKLVGCFRNHLSSVETSASLPSRSSH